MHLGSTRNWVVFPKQNTTNQQRNQHQSGIRSSWCRHSTYVEITAHAGGIPFIYIVVVTGSIYSK